MRIQNNITAMNTHRQYTINNDAVARNAEKLSSGYRINRAGDDAAGLAISEKMRSQIRGLNMATKNSQDAISLVQTAEGALQETQNMLQRMNELAVQAATGTNETLDRNALAKEFEQLKREINDIAEQTNFNNMKILDGSMSFEGFKRSAATSGINTTTELTTGASAKAMSAGKVTNGSDLVEASPATGAQFTLAAAGDLSEDVVEGQTYTLNVDAGGEKGTISYTAQSSDVGKKVGKLFDGKSFAVSAPAAQAEGEEEVAQSNWTAKWDDNKGLTFTRTQGTDGLHKIDGPVTASLDKALATADIEAEKVTVQPGLRPKNQGWEITDEKLSQAAVDGETYNLDLVDAKGNQQTISVKADAKNPAHVDSDGNLKSVGQLLADAITAGKSTFKLTDGGASIVEYKANWYDGTLRLEEDATSADGNLGDLKSVSFSTGKALAATAGSSTGETGPAMGFTNGGASNGAQLKLNLTEALTDADGELLKATEGQTYSFRIKMNNGEVATLTGSQAKDGQTILDTLDGATVKIGDQTFKVEDLHNDQTSGIIRLEGDKTAALAAPTGITNITTAATGLDSVQFLTSDATSMTGKEADEQVTQPASIKIETDSTGNADPNRGDALDFQDTTVGGKEYKLTLSDGVNEPVTISVEDKVGGQSIGALFASAFDGRGDAKIKLGDGEYKLAYNAGSDILELQSLALPDASNNYADLAIPLIPGETTAVLTENEPSRPIALNGEPKNEKVAVTETHDYQLASQEYKIKEDDLKIGDKITIGGKTYEVAARTETGTATPEIQADDAEAADEKEDTVKLSKDGFLKAVADQVTSDAEGRGMKMELTDNGFKLTEKATPTEAGGDETSGLNMKRSGADLKATFEASSNLTKTTIEIDAVKLKAGDTVSVKVDGNEFTYKVQDGDNADKVINGLYSETLGKLTDLEDVEAKGNAIIVKGQKVDVESGFVARDEDPNSYNAVRIQVGALEGEQLSISIDAMNTKGLGLDDAHLMDPDNKDNLTTLDQDAAGRAITATRDAINKVSDQRATLGAMQNRLDHKIANLKVSSENLSAAESRIRDVDMAQEMTNFTKNNILSQAATAMLAQANSLPQNVLSLLG